MSGLGDVTTRYKWGVAEWYQLEWSIGYLNILKTSMVVQRSLIPPLRGARGM